MKITTNTFGLAARRRNSIRISTSLLSGAAVGCLVLGWTVYANVFSASVYPTLGNAGYDLPAVKRPTPAATSFAERSAAAFENITRIAEVRAPQPVPAPATRPSSSALLFNERFAAASPQGEPSRADQAPTAQTQQTQPQIAQAKPSQTSKLAEAARPKPTAQAPVKLAMNAPSSSVRSAESAAEKGTGASIRDMAQRAKAAVMSIASADRPSITEKLWGKPQPKSSLLSFASADMSTASIPSSQNIASEGTMPRYERDTAVYDISARMVYLPDGTKLEAHSGLGSKLDDPSSAPIRMHGVTPPHLYELTPRESLFHGVPALRLTPVGGEEAIYGRSGLLAHTFMLGPNGDSNGCVSFRDYNAFLNAYRNQGIKRLAVVARID